MVINKTVEEFGALDILISNAGIAGPPWWWRAARAAKEYTPRTLRRSLPPT